MSTPEDSLWFEDDDAGTTGFYVGDRGEWYRFTMTPQKALAWAKVLTDYAAGEPVPNRPDGEEASPWMPKAYVSKAVIFRDFFRRTDELKRELAKPACQLERIDDVQPEEPGAREPNRFERRRAAARRGR